MKKKTELVIAKTGMALSMLMLLVMIVETIFPNLLPELPGWLSALSVFVCACLPMLFCSILGSRVPTYKTEDWSSDTPNGVGIISIASTLLMILITIPITFLPMSIKHKPEASVIYGLVTLMLFIVIIVEWISLHRWKVEFWEELYPKVNHQD